MKLWLTPFFSFTSTGFRQAAEEAKRRAEEEAREQAEYERLKKEFSIEDEGTDVVQRDSKAEAEFNAQLISVIQTAKIISVEHLALEFGLKTEVSSS